MNHERLPLAAWLRAPLALLAEVDLGKTPRKADYLDSGPHKIIKFRDVSNAGISWRGVTRGFVRASAVPSLMALRARDVLVTASAHTSDQIGRKVALVDILPPEFETVSFVGELLRIRLSASSADQLARLIFYYVASPDGFQQIQEHVRGGHLLASEARQITVPVCGEQLGARVVDAIDSYLSRLEAAVATLEAAQTKLKAYRASVLKAAVEGRIVPTEAALARAEKRDFEPADVLLKRILSERRRRWEQAELAKLKAAGKSPRDDRWKATYEEPKPPDAKDLPELPEGWCWATLPLLGELNRGKSKHRPRNDPRLLDGPYPFVQTGDVRNADTWLRAFDATYSEFGLAQSRLWPAGTMCITIAANIAETAILTFEACFPDSVVGFLQDDPLLTRYVELFLRTAKQRLDQYAPATAQKNINLEILSKVAVPLPPRDEQGRLVEEVDRLLSVAAAATTSAHTDEKRIARLRQALLKWAFEGKLVDQDPNDEPAAKLLDRIRAERANGETPKRTRRTRKGQ